jgi:hypothetical protein
MTPDAMDLINASIQPDNRVHPRGIALKVNTRTLLPNDAPK